MSNNRFLQNKKPNRFDILLDDDNKDNQCLKKISDENKKNSKYEPSKNSFTQPFKRDESHNNYEDRNKNRQKIDKNSNRNNNNNTNDRNKDKFQNEQGNNRFKNNEKEQLQQSKIDFNDTNLFPELVNKENDSKNIKDDDNIFSLKFKDILDDSAKKDDTQKIVHISPGWLQMTIVDRKIVTKHGQSTPYMEKIEKQKELENDIDHIMHNIVETLKINYEVYEKNYDLINGEGAYNEKFRLSAVYGSEYDTESESEDNSSNNDINDESYDDNDEYSYNE
jgi:hypothetical protein